ncbi:transposase [Streptomyces anulatus]
MGGPASGQLLKGRSGERGNRATLVANQSVACPRSAEVLAKLDREVPDGLQVHLILDNYATHKTPEIKKWLLAHPRFHLHFTPTSASWLNLVERWFAELTQKKLKRGVHRSVQALERDVRAWLAAWNDQPRPFIWTKTADEILDKVAAYCHRISDSGQ